MVSVDMDCLVIRDKLLGLRCLVMTMACLVVRVKLLGLSY